MLRRLISGLSTSRSFVKSAHQRSIHLCSRRLSTSPDQADASKGSGKLVPKIAFGATAVGIAVAAAYQAGYLSDLQFKNEGSSTSQKEEVHQTPTVEEDSPYHVPFSGEKAADESLKPEVAESISKDSPTDVVETIESGDSEDLTIFENNSQDSIPESVVISEELSPLEKEESGLPATSLDELPKSDEGSASEISSKDSVDSVINEHYEGSLHMEHSEETNPNEAPVSSQIPDEVSEEHKGDEEDISLPSKVVSLEADKEGLEIPVHRQSPDVYISLTENEEVSSEVSDKINASPDQKFIVDLIDAIHAAEIRQAESDHRLFSMEKQKMKEKFEKELRDARARELMFAEEAAILDKELNRERLKAEVTVKLLEEKAEENLRVELLRKEEEMELEVRKIQELGKAELNAAISKEKSSHLEQMSEANLNIRALCMAFYARSEEARQNYSIHKLALGALALENALSKGLPIKAEIDSLQSSIVGLDKDSLLDLVLASLPTETLENGTDTLLQLNQKFDSLKGTLRHFSLIPLGGGGMLAHAVAHFASAIKMREKHNRNGEGIESVISKVENLLAEGNLAEAADILEREVSGTEAEGAISEWVKLARHRAITEQAISLLQAYATSTSLT